MLLQRGALSFDNGPVRARPDRVIRGNRDAREVRLRRAQTTAERQSAGPLSDRQLRIFKEFFALSSRVMAPGLATWTYGPPPETEEGRIRDAQQRPAPLQFAVSSDDCFAPPGFSFDFYRNQLRCAVGEAHALKLEPMLAHEALGGRIPHRRQRPELELAFQIYRFKREALAETALNTFKHGLPRSGSPRSTALCKATERPTRPCWTSFTRIFAGPSASAPTRDVSRIAIQIQPHRFTSDKRGSDPPVRVVDHHCSHRDFRRVAGRKANEP